MFQELGGHSISALRVCRRLLVPWLETRPLSFWDHVGRSFGEFSGYVGFATGLFCI